MSKGNLPATHATKNAGGPGQKQEDNGNGTEPTERIVIDAEHVPAVAAAHQQDTNEFTTDSGVRIRLRHVSPQLMDAVQRRLKRPEVPMWYNEDKGRDEPNPGDPAYMRAVEEFDSNRVAESTRCILIWGVELVDGLPSDQSWLRMLAMVGIDVDATDEFAVQLAYKQYVAISSPLDLAMVIDGTGMSEDSVKRSLAGFRRPA